MKLSRNALVGSLAVTGMVLGALAPSLTAQAARTSGVPGKTDGSTVEKTASTDKDGMEDAGQLGKGNLAIAYTDATTGAPVGTAAAYSNASVNVVSGILVLDQVPDFNFGAAASGSVKGLVDNSKGTQSDAAENSDGTAAIDGNAQGNLQVIESRSALTGFTVSAAVGDFKDSKGTAVTGSGATDNAFILNLKPANMTLNGEDYKNGNVNYQTQEANITAATASNPNTDTAQPGATSAKVMQVNADQAGYKTGTYAAALNTSDLVSLTVPSGIGSGQSVKSLNSTITWTLAANPLTGAGVE